MIRSAELIKGAYNIYMMGTFGRGCCSKMKIGFSYYLKEAIMRRIMLVLLLTVLSMTTWAQGGTAEPRSNDRPFKEIPASAKGQPLSWYLNQDGTLELPAEGIQGSLDPTGYRLVSGPDTPPRFEAVENDGAPGSRVAADENWDSRFTFRGVGSQVSALASDGTNVFAGGFFAAGGGIPANKIAKWDGSAWSALGTGMSSYVNALAWDGSNLYAGGYFTTAGGVSANRVAKWDGSAWSALGTGMNKEVKALCWDGTNLYAGGSFTTADDVIALSIAKWNGTSWSALGSGPTGPFYPGNSIYALVWDGTNLYAGGDMFQLGYIVKWDGSSWNALGSGMNTNVYALAWKDNILYAGGKFTKAGGVTVNYIAMWNGSAWSALGTGMDHYVQALAWYGANLYVGGSFTIAGGISTGGIAKWNGSEWSALGTGMINNVYALILDSVNLYAGGSFADAGGVVASNIAKWDGVAWTAMPDSGLAISEGVNALAWDGSNLYVGGHFVAAGGIPANSIAKWDGCAWSALGTGTSGGYVYALAWDGTNLYAGGSIATAGDVTNHIAKWDGRSWSALGSGVDGPVAALVMAGTDLYVGGSFLYAGGVSANRIAKWNGVEWRPLGTGINNNVYALAWDGSNLYAGGYFTTAGGVSANNIAKWDGSVWSALGTGVNYYVYALALGGSNLYAGGYFTTAGGMSANNIAQWNGSAWSSLGAGTNNSVDTLAWDGDYLYVGGLFTTSGGTFTGGIAKWDGSTWSALGSGTNRNVVALGLYGTNLWIGGGFEVAGGRVSGHVGHWCTPLATATGITATVNRCDGIRVTWNSVAGAAGYDVLRGTTCGVALDKFTNVASPFDDTTASPGTSYQYWVVPINACGNAGANSSCVVGARMATAPASPTGVSATNDRCNDVRVTWNSVVGAESYNVLRGTSCSLALDTFNGVTSPFDDTTASPGTTYQYWVVAVNACGSTSSSCTAGIMPSGPPGTFAQTSPPDGQSSCSVSPTFYWSAAPAAITYTVYLNSTPLAGCKGITATQCRASELIEDTSYSWKVRAYTCPSLFADSTTWSLTTGSSQNIPLDLTNDLRITHAGEDVNLDWSLMGTPGPQTTHYHIYRSDSAEKAFSAGWILVDGAVSTQEYIDVTAGDGLWFYDVRSANDCDNICPAP